MPENGRSGEEKAILFLRNAGYEIVDRNFRHRGGEVDIIAFINDTLVFVEVKTWSVYGLDALEQGMNKKKQQRIIETAKYFLLLHREYKYMAIRFDIIFIAPGAPGSTGDITHLASAFMESV